MTFLLFLGSFGGSKGFKCVQNIIEYQSQYLQTYFVTIFQKKYFVKNIFGKNIFSKIFFCAYFCNFFSAKCLIIISYSLPQLTLPKNITFRGFQRGGHNVPPPLSQMWAQDPLSIRVNCESVSRCFQQGEVGAFSWLKAPTSAFTFKTLLRHYAKRAFTVKLGPRRNYHKGRAAIRHYAYLMNFVSRTQFHVERPWGQRPFSIVS